MTVVTDVLSEGLGRSFVYSHLFCSLGKRAAKFIIYIFPLDDRLYLVLFFVVVHGEQPKIACVKDDDTQAIYMCKDGCNSYNLMTAPPLFETNIIMDSSDSNMQCSLTLQIDPGYGMTVGIAGAGVTLEISSCDGNCGSGNYLSINGKSCSQQSVRKYIRYRMRCR